MLTTVSQTSGHLNLLSQPPTHPPSPLSAVSTHQASSSIAPSDSISEAISEATTTIRSSWVWQYFAKEMVQGQMKNVCRSKEGFTDTPILPTDDADAPIILCNKSMALDKQGSTKSMIRHLERCHHIFPPVNTNQQTLSMIFTSGKLPKVSLLSFHLIVLCRKVKLMIFS